MSEADLHFGDIGIEWIGATHDLVLDSHRKVMFISPDTVVILSTWQRYGEFTPGTLTYPIDQCDWNTMKSPETDRNSE